MTSLKPIKQIVLLLLLLVSTSICKSQSNHFPSSGFVGVGTSSPNSQLHISGNTLNYMDRYVGSNGFIAAAFRYRTARGSFNSPSANLSGDWLGSLNFTGYAGSSFSNYTAAAIVGYAAEDFTTSSQGTGISFWTSPLGTIGSVTERMRILPNGNIGIGTTTTGSHKLAVNGSIGAREIKVEMTSWPDFVFGKTYNLMSLEELEAFIELEGHLPNIPKEDDVINSGIELGDMNKRLLQKIEELTLHMIQQNKELIKVNKELAELKTKLATMNENKIRTSRN
ncbi:hypothetical protein [Roseivirga spongicola]|uniref:hypothetical protein n=1 Tax=Roseivirga spongicola TaxID=333140 RepID=UPI000AEB4B9C|nr:hypothetical protein [Roseivirga spongicola]